MNDVQILATALTERDDAEDPLVDEVWEHPPASRVLDCVLSLNRPYDRFVVPRVAELNRRHPEIETTRAETLNGVLRYLQDAQTKFEGDGVKERLSRWAADAGVSLRSVDVALWEERARGSTP